MIKIQFLDLKSKNAKRRGVYSRGALKYNEKSISIEKTLPLHQKIETLGHEVIHYLIDLFFNIRIRDKIHFLHEIITVIFFRGYNQKDKKELKEYYFIYYTKRFNLISEIYCHKVLKFFKI